jgi:hypothetical protein
MKSRARELISLLGLLVSTACVAPVVADLDADGRRDLVTVNETTRRVVLNTCLP